MSLRLLSAMGRRETRTQGELVAALRGATEDAVLRLPLRSGGQGFDFQQPPRPPTVLRTTRAPSDSKYSRAPLRVGLMRLLGRRLLLVEEDPHVVIRVE